MARPSSCRTALKYFSAACWQKKQTWSCRAARPAANFLAAVRSFLALRSHCLVRPFIEHLALGDDLAQEPISLVEPPAQVLRGAHDYIEWKGVVRLFSDSH